MTLPTSIFGFGDFRSFSWHAGPRILRLFSGIIGSAVVARHLGPENFGTLAFATMVATWAGCLVQTGSLEVITKNTAVYPAQIPQWIRLGLLFRLLGAIPAAVVVWGASLWFGSAGLYAVLALFPLTLIPDAVEAVFFGRSQFHPTAPIRMGAAMAGLAGRLILAFSGAGLDAFAWITVGEGILTGVLMLWKSRGMWGFSSDLPPWPWRSFLRQSLPLAASAAVVGLALRLDQFILQSCRAGAEIGHYLAVVRLFEMGNILVPSLLAVLLPDLARWRHLATEEYQHRMIRLYALTYRWGFTASCVLALLAPVVVPLLFGEAFQASVPIFMAYAFTFPSFVVGNIRAMDFVVRDQNIHHLTVILFLVPIQIPLCWWAASWAGPVGLALAMVAVTFISTTLFSLWLPPLREAGKLQALALKSLIPCPASKH